VVFSGEKATTGKVALQAPEVKKLWSKIRVGASGEYPRGSIFLDKKMHSSSSGAQYGHSGFTLNQTATIFYSSYFVYLLTGIKTITLSP